MLEREPPDHTRLRRLVNRAFTSSAINAARPRIEALAHRLIDGFGDRVDLIAAYATPIPVITIAELLGTPVDAAEAMLAWSHAMVAMYQHNRSREIEDAAVRATSEFSQFMTDHIEAKRKRPGDDLLSRLIVAEEEGQRLSRDELVTTAILLMNAGHEATVHAIANAALALLRHGINTLPHLADSESATLAVDELLRFDPPLHLFTRYAYDDIEIGGCHIRKGEEVGLLLASANHDPAIFDDPATLDLARNKASHTSFGAGIHFCVGAPLARAEIEIALRTLFDRCPKLRLATEPRFADRYHFHGLERLDVSI
jgi:cytochrome P450